jgi:Transposase DDE domain/Transposase domain (DUF772)
MTAFDIARRCLPRWASSRSRQDFDLWQLFACLVLREHQRKSYRGIVAVLRDSPEWCAAIGLSRVPDHSTLCRAFKTIMKMCKAYEFMLDRMVNDFNDAEILGDRLSLDSTHLERWHSSKYYDYRVAQSHGRERKSHGNAGRSDAVKAMPKLGLGVDTASHLILSMKTRTGMGSDAPDFDDLLFDGWRRGNVKVVLADAGYDSEANHLIARRDMNVRSIIPARVGRPTNKQPSGYWRRQMKQRMKRKDVKKEYGQRWQSETVNSMVKRNMGSSLRARTPERREMEMKLRVLTHNIMLLAKLRNDGRN